MTAQWALLVVGSAELRPFKLPPGRALTIGSDEGAGLRLPGPQVARVHCSLLVREQVRLELVRGQPGTLLNGVPLSGPTVLHDGDELVIGTTRLLLHRVRELPAVTVRTLSWDECVDRIHEEMGAGDPLRSVVLGLVQMPTLNASARQALLRRVRDEVAQLREPAVLSEFSTDVMAVVMPRASAGGAERLRQRLPVVAGAHARTVVVASGAGVFSGDHLVQLACTQLWPGAGELEFISHHPFVVRLADVLATRVSGPGVLVVRGAEGSGRTALIRHAASLAGAPMPQVLRAFERWPADDKERLPFHPDSRDRPLWVTALTGTPMPSGLRVVDLPPLQARGDDVLAIAEAQVSLLRASLGRVRLALTSAARDALMAWPWPGQVRELLVTLTRAAHAAVGDEIGAEVLPARMTQGAVQLPLVGARESAEKKLLLEALARTRWNVSAAATRLGIPRRTLVYQMARLKMKRPSRSGG